MLEKDIQNAIRVALSTYGKFFRVNVGTGWTGSEIKKLIDGSVIIRNARPFSTGIPPGASDIIGVVTVTITPEMVGQQIGIATFVEVKTHNGRVSNDQKNFLSVMLQAGCRAGVARSVNDAVSIATGRSRD